MQDRVKCGRNHFFDSGGHAKTATKNMRGNFITARWEALIHTTFVKA